MAAALHFINRYCPQRAVQTPALPRRFMVEICRPDGSVDRTTAEGGSSIDHSCDAMERGGLGAVVRVTPLPFHVAGEPA